VPFRVKDLRSSAKYKYSVPGIVPSFAQSTAQTCWATVATMMVSWYDSTTYTIAQVMDQAGPAYRTKFENNHGLSHSEKDHFLAALGLYEEPATRYTAAILFSLMQVYGPLLITTVEVPTQDFAIRARVLTGICGDGSLENTYLQVNNPTDGQINTESLSDITQDLGCAPSKGDELCMQIVHF
jgi:Papain-like cysteine protease AvrRpt2